MITTSNLLMGEYIFLSLFDKNIYFRDNTPI